jgi:nicotinic acid phosphoribosyltransferase
VSTSADLLDAGALLAGSSCSVRSGWAGTAPWRQVQLAETRIINLLPFRSLIAAKAARWSSQRSSLVDFELGRTHGADARLLTTRAGHIAGCANRSLAAGQCFEIPTFGTTAHSCVAHARATRRPSDQSRSPQEHLRRKI